MSALTSTTDKPTPAITTGTPIAMEDDAKKTVSFFEFWPGWLMYMPVIVQWVGLSIYYRSLTVPFLANPDLTLSGMVGVPKSELMIQANGLCKETILDWVVFDVNDKPSAEQVDEWIVSAAQHGIHLPFVCKPDIGCRGVGVKLVKSAAQLANIIESYPQGTSLMCQKLATWEPEVGIFYVKDPISGRGDVVSMTSKFLPTVTGDGVRTLGDLIESDKRAGPLVRLYHERHKDDWDRILENGEAVRLVFSASHSKGAIFRDAYKYITPELTHAIARIMDDLPSFYYGRLDVKYADLESLQGGKTMEIVEINAASSEAVHIWDKDAKYFDAVKTLLWQYRTLFRLGAYHRAQGRKAPSVVKFIRHLMVERRLSKHYPSTD